MAITSKTTDIVILGIFHAYSKTAVYGSIKKLDGSTDKGIIQVKGDYIWRTVELALDEAKVVKMRNLLMLCNDKDLASIYMRPVCIPQPDTKRIWTGGKRGRYVNVPVGGCPHMWAVIRHTALYKQWRMVHKKDLNEAIKLWQQN